MIYRFGDFELDDPLRELRFKETIAPVEPKMFQVLHYLIKHRDRVLSKDELLEHCWPDTFVTPSALNRCLSKLRQLLHRDSPQDLIIKTVHWQGYRFRGGGDRKRPRRCPGAP
ncbi:hypothetical protein C2W62_28545 [Candidatus Entotheonella serta]|nr:hypothetical protein C2W62_28545 [Candidatus Entotheonella serta]